MTDGVLAEVLAEAGIDLEAERRDAGATTEWFRDGRLFAAFAAGCGSFRLDGPIVRAALRTPDTRPSGRGADWIDFVPAEPDEYAMDRARSWFEAAWRRATGA